MSINHYENFPVGSLLLPQRLRRPIHAIYAFARTADDIADEGNMPTAERLFELNILKEELNRIAQSETPHTQLMQKLYTEAICPFSIPLEPFYHLLEAFSQDTIKTRYAHFGELVDYARRSANPVGRIMLHLYGQTDALSIARSDGICTALQLINFWQDIAIDWQKGRIYLPQEDLHKFGVTESHLANQCTDKAFQALMAYECHRTFNMLKAGAPLGRTLKGRIGLELRMIILGGQTILKKLDENQYDIFKNRPILMTGDWLKIIYHAIHA